MSTLTASETLSAPMPVAKLPRWSRTTAPTTSRTANAAMVQGVGGCADAEEAAEEAFVPEEEEPAAEWRHGQTQGDHLMRAKAKRQSLVNFDTYGLGLARDAGLTHDAQVRSFAPNRICPAGLATHSMFFPPFAQTLWLESPEDDWHALLTTSFDACKLLTDEHVVCDAAPLGLTRDTTRQTSARLSPKTSPCSIRSSFTFTRTPLKLAPRSWTCSSRLPDNARASEGS